MSKRFYLQMTVCTLFFIFILIFSGKANSVTNDSDLNKMMDIISKHNGNIEEWSVLAREELELDFSYADFEKVADQWQKEIPDFTWEKQISQDRLILTGKSSDQSLPYAEKIQLTTELNGKNIQGFILYEIKGSEWNEKVSHLVDERQEYFLPKFFHKSPSFFSCIKGEFNDMIDKSLLEKSMTIIHDFNGKKIENLVENNFVSLTVNSPLFTKEIPTEAGSFDMQISLRKTANEDKTTFVIGTPILTIEY
ncbi:YwmB family TATA-box binding protein [Caldifermentibacillus hisashii]|uniref:YwmB family TATA-box binding protein n=1 Tax=Caldifermentibacillus hisashii TaxID=996558 RepID=UPI003D23A71A